MPNEPISHAFLTEDILHRLRAVAVATSNALDAMLDGNPQYQRGNIDAVRAVGQAIGVNPFAGDDKAQLAANDRHVHLRRDARNILESIHDATVSALESGGGADPAYLDGFTNTLRSIARSLDLYRPTDESEGRALAKRPQRTTPQRQLPAPVEDAYVLESRSGRAPAGLQEYLDRYGIKATVAADTTGCLAQIRLHGVSEARREWAEHVIDKWSAGHGWNRR